MKCPRTCPYDQSCPIGNVKEKIHPEPRKKKQNKKKQKKKKKKRFLQDCEFAYMT